MNRIRKTLSKIYSNTVGHYLIEATCVLLINFAFVYVAKGIFFHVSFFNPVSRALESFDMTDIYYDVMKQESPDTSEVITFVDVTPLYDRRQIASVFEMVHDMKPAVMGVDISFEGMKYDPLGSEYLQAVAQSCPEAVFAFKLEDLDPQTKTFKRQVHSFFAQGGKVNEGIVNTNTRKSGEVERTLTMRQDIGGKAYYHLAAAVAAKWLGQKHPTWKDKEQLHIDYSPKSFRVISCYDVDANRQYIEGHIVLIGGVYDRSDTHFTPLGKKPGIEIWAYAIDTILQGNEVQKIEGFRYWFNTFVLCWIITLMYCWYRQRVSSTKQRIVSYLMGMSLTINLLISVVVTILAGLGYYVFHNWNLDLRLELAISLVILTVNAFSIYEFIEKVVTRPINKLKAEKK